MAIHIPPGLLSGLAGIKGFDAAAFLAAHESGQPVTSIRFNNNKNQSLQIGFNGGITQVPWCIQGRYLATRPSFTFDPYFHAGWYYVQEASSMFLEQALRQHTDMEQPLRVLDLCAAPGGKSTHLQSLINKESLLVANETIKTRAAILKDNIIKWGAGNVMVTNNDARDFQQLPGFFDVVVVDAPCSGSGLFRKDAAAVEEWSPENVNRCNQRQQRILADVWPALKDGGTLIYATCSFSPEEDENITDWLVKDMGAENVTINIPENWHITETQTNAGNTGYRFWPHLVQGEGFYLSVFKKNDEVKIALPKIKKKPDFLSKKDETMLADWLGINDYDIVNNNNHLYLWPKHLSQDFILLLQQLRAIYSGTMAGELMHRSLVPHHALAMGRLLHKDVPVIDLSYEEAIAFLQKKEINLSNKKNGWAVVAYNGANLGWVKVLPNRVNNYYPKELRILKDKLQ